MTIVFSKLLEFFQGFPPIQENLAWTGNAAIRCSSKDLRSLFDKGLCFAWGHLKQDASKENTIIAVFMKAIEKNQGQITEQNSLRFFQQLKKEVHLHWNRELLFVDPSVDLPTRISFFGLLGLKYEKDCIPQRIQERADQIIDLRIRFKPLSQHLLVPRSYLDPLTDEIMECPIFDSSHPAFETACAYDLSEGESHPKSIYELCHIRDQEAYEKRLIEMAPFVPGCPLCEHPVKEGTLFISTVLQEEILNFLKKAIDESAVKTEKRSSWITWIKDCVKRCTIFS